MEILFLLFFMLIPGAMFWYAFGLLGFGKIKDYSDVPSGNDLIFKADHHAKNNPWVSRIAASPLYGKVPGNVKELMERVSADLNEKVIGSIWVLHGPFQAGYLVITTSYLRWIQIFPFGKEELFWQHHTRIDKVNLELLCVEDYQFQLRGNPLSGRATNFVKLHGLVQQAMLHHDAATESTHGNGDTKHTGSPHKPGIAEEIKELSLLRQQNIITEEEFKAGKQRLLDKS